MKIGYAKLGRIMTVDPKKYGPQGDAEAPQLLQRLARRNPQHEFIVIGKYGKDVDKNAYPSNVTFPWPENLSRGFWHYGDGEYRCSFCKAAIYNTDPVPRCCAEGMAVYNAEQELIRIAGEELDGFVVHLGQHGSSNHPIVMANRSPGLTSPQVMMQNCGGYLIRAINAMHDRTDGKAPVSYICTDPRNYLKARDLKWPTGLNRILSQYEFNRDQTHERLGDTRSPEEVGASFSKTAKYPDQWTTKHQYKLGGLELMILPDDWESWGKNNFYERTPVGIATTASWDDNPLWRRSYLVKTFVMDEFPDAEVFGRWDKKSLEVDAGAFEVKTNPVADFPDILQRWRITVALQPPSRSLDGIQWTTAKPYQAFAARTACLFVGPLDSLGWMLPARRQSGASHEVAPGWYSVRDDWTPEDYKLADWLRVDTPEEAKVRIDAIDYSPRLWEWIVDQQRDLLLRRWNQHYTERIIEHQLGLSS